MILQLNIEADAALHHGSGFGMAGLVDRAILRDETGMPYLAGSAIKGKFRAAAAQLLRSHGRKPCGSPAAPWCKGEQPCPLCGIFGSPRRAGSAIFEDCYPAPPADSVLRAVIQHRHSPLLAGGADVRSSCAIDRYTRRARPQHLFSTESVPPLLRFQGQILGEFDPEQVKLLNHSAKILTHFGGDSSRGMGLCRYELTEVAG